MGRRKGGSDNIIDLRSGRGRCDGRKWGLGGKILRLDFYSEGTGFRESGW